MNQTKQAPLASGHWPLIRCLGWVICTVHTYHVPNAVFYSRLCRRGGGLALIVCIYRHIIQTCLLVLQG